MNGLFGKLAFKDSSLIATPYVCKSAARRCRVTVIKITSSPIRLAPKKGPSKHPAAKLEERAREAKTIKLGDWRALSGIGANPAKSTSAPEK